MLYTAYEMNRTLLNGASAWANASAEMLSHPLAPWAQFGVGPVVTSALEVFAHASAPRGKPAFGIETVTVNGKNHVVAETIVDRQTFGNLLRFHHAGLPKDAPRLLIAAPMSGHYATLLRGTVERMLQSCEVYITDWADAKMVPQSAGRFDLDDYIDYLIAWLEHVAALNNGTRAHMLAVCQPSVPSLAAVAVMGAAKHPARPLTLTMMGGPIDTRQAPTSVNALATERPISWFENTVVTTVPLGYPGAGRKVYPGFLQLAGFLGMNLNSHVMSHYTIFKQLVAGDDDSADTGKAFYDEYLSVCDMTAEFYLQTVENVFQRHSLPKGELRHRNVPVDLATISDTALLAIEGENDDISGIGQTRAALTCATGLAENRKTYFLAPDVGHYGIFNGSKWRNIIAPQVESFIAKQSKRKSRPDA